MENKVLCDLGYLQKVTWGGEDDEQQREFADEGWGGGDIRNIDTINNNNVNNNNMNNIDSTNDISDINDDVNNIKT